MSESEMGVERPGFDPERWAAPLVAAGAALLGVGVARLPGAWGLLVLPGLLLLGLACVSARDGFLLFGPFPHIETVRHTRRHRTHLWVLGAPLTAGGVVAVMLGVGNATARGGATSPEFTAAVTFLFVAFGLLGFVGVLMFTVYLMAILLTEDRESKRADFLLATDLRGREIVVGRAAGRLAVVSRYPLAVLPVLALLPPLFGVDPAVLLLAAGYAGVTLVSAAGLAALASVLSATKQASGRVLTQFLLPYLAAGMGLNYVCQYPAVWVWPGTPAAPAAVSVGDVADWLNAGNPFARRWLLGWLSPGGADPVPAAADLPGYAAFHLTVGVLALALAARWVRSPVADADTTGAAGRPRPPVTDRPVFWKEQYLNPVLSPLRRRPGQTALTLLILYGLPVAGLLLAAVADLGPYTAAARQVGRFYPVLWAFILGIFPAQVAVFSLPREREQDTLTGLLAAPLDPADIAAERMRAALWMFRWVPASVLLAAVAGAAAGGFPWVGIPALLLGTGVHMYQGMTVAAVCGATARNRAAVNVSYSLLAVPLVAAPMLGVMGLFAATGGPVSPIRFGLVGLCVPFALLATAAADQVPAHELPLWAAGLLAGLTAHAALGYWGWRLAVRRFVRSCDPDAARGPLLSAREAR